MMNLLKSLDNLGESTQACMDHMCAFAENLNFKLYILHAGSIIATTLQLSLCYWIQTRIISLVY